MADLDTGHIFLTTLAPIKQEMLVDQSRTSFEQNVRIALAKLPTAKQSPATQHEGHVNSPFSRNKRNHLARMFVLDDTVYNGRVGKNAIAATIAGDDPIDSQKVDKLNCSYLVFCADIDAISRDGDPLPTNLSVKQQKEVRAAYARELWTTMEMELRDIYRNCVGFETVDTAEDFATYLDKCHVETTMPFHDYYLELPEFHNLNAKALLYAVLVPAGLALLSLLLRILGMIDLPLVGWSTLYTFLILLVLAVVIAVFSYRYAIKNGEKPLAPGKFDDLPSVLKALYMQQAFANFVVDHQGCTADKLHAEFGAFLEQHKPRDVTGPTQPPGVISSAKPDLPGAEIKL